MSTTHASPPEVRRAYADQAAISYSFYVVGASTAFIAVALSLSETQAGLHSSAMAVGMIVAGLAGTSIPLLLERAGIDPAVASGVSVISVGRQAVVPSRASVSRQRMRRARCRWHDARRRDRSPRRLLPSPLRGPENLIGEGSTLNDPPRPARRKYRGRKVVSLRREDHPRPRDNGQGGSWWESGQRQSTFRSGNKAS